MKHVVSLRRLLIAVLTALVGILVVSVPASAGTRPNGVIESGVAPADCHPGSVIAGDHLSDDDLAAVARNAGFPDGDDNLATAIAVALAESNGWTQAVLTNSDAYCSRDRGLWQINDHWHPEVTDAQAFDPNQNAAAAYRISSGGTNWTQWSTYKNGSYKAFLDRARAAAADTSSGASAKLAAVGHTDGTMTIFARGADHKIWTAWQSTQGGPWSDWFHVNDGGDFVDGGPAAIAHADGTMTLFARGSDGKLWTCWQNSQGGSYTDWFPVNNGTFPAGSSPAAVGHSNESMTVFMRGGDGKIMTAWQSQPGGTYSDWFPVNDGDFSTSSPTAVGHADGTMTLFARGGDNKIWTCWQDKQGGPWSGWFHVNEGDFADPSPSAVGHANESMTVFALGGDVKVWTAWQNQPGGGYTDWFHVNDTQFPATSSPTGVGHANGSMTLFIRGGDGKIWTAWQSQPGGNWSDWFPVNDGVLA